MKKYTKLIFMLIILIVIVICCLLLISYISSDKTKKIKTEIETSENDKDIFVTKEESTTKVTTIIKNENVTNVKQSSTTMKKNIKKNTTTTKVVTTTSKIINTTTTQKVETTITTTKSCIPKKFYLSFFRADFDSMEACQNMGNKYLDKYGYNCTYTEDDCGDTYYMLRLFDSKNDSLDYHTIPIP